jgi:hypothetical protein
MSEVQGPQGNERQMSPEELAWAKAHLPVMHRWVSRQRFLQEAMVMAFAFGLVVHVAGYLLQTVANGEPLRLLADLLATLGTTVWTGVVLFAFIEVLPAAKRRSGARWLAAFEAEVRAQSGPDEP